MQTNEVKESQFIKNGNYDQKLTAWISEKTLCFSYGGHFSFNLLGLFRIYKTHYNLFRSILSLICIPMIDLNM